MSKYQTMSKGLNQSTSLAKQLSKAAGESFVTYRLSRKGWLVINANSGVQNMPNFDLIAMKDDRRVTVQVKTGRDPSHISMAGTYREDGIYFNTKDGPKADVVAFVRLDPSGKDDVFFVPVRRANTIAKALANSEAKIKRARGSSLHFPIWARVKGATKRKHGQRAMAKVLPFRDADI